mmetsp:Transcript_68943/g.218011  ORF Transcript_68943/g.218011 Transcript_68943/m.218011 type:complete len:198 (+) Transcript_68943:703-1296(+)
MIVDKPDWVSHGGPIFSLDIHPEGVRFATGGEDHKVRIWGMGPVLSKKEEGDADVPKILATLVDHFGPVNVVRWSRDGRFIASGSDDKIIIITELRPGGGQATFGSTDTPNVENWKALHSLRSHKSNVTDVAWSVGDAMIASCSVDNEVIIWDPREPVGRQERDHLEGGRLEHGAAGYGALHQERGRDLLPASLLDA